MNDEQKEDNYQMPKKYALDIMKKYVSIEEFKEKYKKCECNYDFKNDIFCGFRGITISKNNMTEYQKLQYALEIKKMLSMDISELEFNKGKYLDIDEFENMIKTLQKSEEKVYRYYTSLDGKKYTLAEIGDMLGVSGERIRQIMKRAVRKLSHPSRSKNIIRDYQIDCINIEEYNKKIEILKSDIEDFQIIIDYFSNNKYNNENIELFKLNLDKNKLDDLKNDSIIYIYDLIKKHYKKANMNFKDTYIWELNLSSRTTNSLNRGGKIETLYDLVNSTESDLFKIRNFGKSSYDEIINKLSSMGLGLKKEGEANDLNIEEFNNLEFNEKEKITERVKMSKKIELENLNDIIKKKEVLESKVISYHKAVEQYLNYEDIFNSEYIVAAIACS